NGALNVDASGGDGGGSLTIGGTLNNTKTMQIANVSTTATTPLSLGALSNPTGASFAVFGSTSHQATLAFSSGGSGFTNNDGSFRLFNTTPLTLNNAFTNSGTFTPDGTALFPYTTLFRSNGALNVDASGGDGGGSLTIGGKLNNTK